MITNAMSFCTMRAIPCLTLLELYLLYVEQVNEFQLVIRTTRTVMQVRLFSVVQNMDIGRVIGRVR
jgi:hypothetical protein